MKKILLSILIFLFLGCGTTRDFNERRNLMLLEPNEMAINKPYAKYSKKKAKKKLQRKIKKQQRQLKRKMNRR